MKTYAELAPEISQIIARATVENFFDVNIVPPEPIEEPTPTPAQLNAIGEAYMSKMKGYNGLAGLGRSIGLGKEQVRRLRNEIEALHTAYLILNAPVVEEPEP